MSNHPNLFRFWYKCRTSPLPRSHTTNTLKYRATDTNFHSIEFRKRTDACSRVLGKTFVKCSHNIDRRIGETIKFRTNTFKYRRKLVKFIIYTATFNYRKSTSVSFIQLNVTGCLFWSPGNEVDSERTWLCYTDSVVRTKNRNVMFLTPIHLQQRQVLSLNLNEWCAWDKVCFASVSVKKRLSWKGST